MPRKRTAAPKTPKALQASRAAASPTPAPAPVPAAEPSSALAGLHPDLLRLLGSPNAAVAETDSSASGCHGAGASQDAPTAQEGAGNTSPPPAVSPEPELTGDDRTNVAKMSGDRLDTFAHKLGIPMSELREARERRGDQADAFIRIQASIAFRRRYAEA